MVSGKKNAWDPPKKNALQNEPLPPNREGGDVKKNCYSNNFVSFFVGKNMPTNLFLTIVYPQKNVLF